MCDRVCVGAHVYMYVYENGKQVQEQLGTAARENGRRSEPGDRTRDTRSAKRGGGGENY
jgi:hypothetical protein